jgi:hypothetical protein
MEGSADVFLEAVWLLTPELTAFSAPGEWAFECKSRLRESAYLRNSVEELATETGQIEAVLRNLRNNIECMTDDPAVDVSKVFRISAREASLQAYLKGLKFKTDVLGLPLAENKFQVEETEKTTKTESEASW